ncbi:MAG: NAD-dependent epimerase/dehydratase family protein [Opitutales bacterium]
MQVLVTGGGGFLGGRIVEDLLARSVPVRVFQRSAAPQLSARGVDVREGSLDDASAVAAACAGITSVFHVAAKAGFWGERAAYVAANVTGTRNVVAACRSAGVRHLIYTSTPSVVFSGEAFEGADESLPYGQNFLCHYAETKAEAERCALSANAPGQLAVCALRPHLIYGPGDPHLLPRVLAKAKEGRLRQVGDGTNRVDITHVANAAAAHLKAWEALQAGRGEGQAYFISDGMPVSLWPWINDVLQRCGVPRIEKNVTLPKAYKLGAIMEWLWRTFPIPGEPPMTRFVATELAKSHWFSIEAARRDLDYAPVIEPQAALQETVAWLKQSQPVAR